ncbi:TonB family protein [Colwellia sp. MSW7]|uniref:Protein TonB n=1 Tax=Colwellia maritima TaxID=2912588 RepID=A0ABS9X6D2_9GAMM|nr:M56 family metallopeptidase [Colwellia maritima]MCI2285805.1 TonB family protein [Colwellia maritima]
MLDNFFNSPILTSLALTLLHFLWQGLLVAVVLKSALLIFNNNKPQLRYALSALAMLVNLLLPIITFIIIYQTEVTSVNTLASSLALNEFIQELEQPDALFTYRELTETLPLLLPYISVLWLATITLLAGKLLIEITTVNRLPQQGTVAPADQLQARFNELVKQINLTIAPRLLISLKVDVPMAIGWLKPVVLLPANMITGLNSAQLEMLILHELAHIRRHDYLVNFLQTLVEILLFFHPGVLWASKQMRNEREYCSDDIAVQHCGNAIAYAHTLADTASLCTKSHNHTIPDMAMAASGGDLKQRVIRLVDHHCAPKNNISKWFASATIIFSVLLLSSKQLLTMPLLDIWYNENPWKQFSQTEPDNAESYLKKSIFPEVYPENKQENDSLDLKSINKSIPISSIAHKLLTPIEQDSQNNEHKIQASSPTENKKQPVDNQLLASTKAATQTKSTSKTGSDETKLTEKLNGLAINHSDKTNKIAEDTITNNTLMVEKAFERTNTKNPYQQEIINLAAAPVSNTNQLSTKPFKNKELNNNNIKNTQIIKSNRDIFTEANLLKEKKMPPIETTWKNAEQLQSVDPVYPSLAKRKGIEIEVKVDFTIDIHGKIKNIQFDHQNNINYFKSSIRSAIKKWRFLPAKVDDRPVESQMTKVFAFSLES